MKAVLINQYGGTGELKYQEVPVPEINADEVLIKIFATSINPIDWKIRQGMIQGLNWDFPVIPGWDLSGVIEKTGSEVSQFKQGEEVYSFPALSPKGTYAEYVAVKANQVAYKPKTIDHLKAASVPLAGLTAWQALFDHGKLQAGQKVFINGAAGGVGTFAIQLAKNAGAIVLGTASEKNKTFLQGLGIDEVIDYTKVNFEDQLKDIDLVLDCIGGVTQFKSVQVLKPGGILVSIVGINAAVDFETKGIEPIFFLTKSLPGQLDKITDLIDNGSLQTTIAAVISLKDIEEAHRLSEQGHTRGKLVISVAS